MDEEVRVTISKVEVGAEHFELVLASSEDSSLRWTKRYHGIIFLSMDGQSLDLPETVTGDGQGKSRLRLKREAFVHPGKLLRMGFRADAEPKSQTKSGPEDIHARSRR